MLSAWVLILSFFLQPCGEAALIYIFGAGIPANQNISDCLLITLTSLLISSWHLSSSYQSHLGNCFSFTNHSHSSSSALAHLQRACRIFPTEGQVVAVHTSRESFCYILACFIHHHVHSFIIISCHSSVLILTGDHVSQCCWLAFWLCCYFCIQTSEFLSCVSSCGACSWHELIHTNLFLASCSGCFC